MQVVGSEQFFRIMFPDKFSRQIVGRRKAYSLIRHASNEPPPGWFVESTEFSIPGSNIRLGTACLPQE
jgi:hypothetical protein